MPMLAPQLLSHDQFVRIDPALPRAQKACSAVVRMV